MTRLWDPGEMVKAVCRSLGVQHKAMLGKSRQQDVVDARSIASFVLKARYGLSYPALAPFIGCSDHTSAMYHFGRAEADPKLAEKARAFLIAGLRDPEEVMS